MIQNKKLKRNATYAIAEVAEVALCASNCALPTSVKKYELFHPHFYKSISALTRQSRTEQKFSENFFCKGVLLDFEISLLTFIHKIFEQNFYLYITVYLVRIWTYKNADEKAHTFSRRSKNVKKRTKNGYCVNSPLYCGVTVRQENTERRKNTKAGLGSGV